MFNSFGSLIRQFLKKIGFGKFVEQLSDVAGSNEVFFLGVNFSHDGLFGTSTDKVLKEINLVNKLKKRAPKSVNMDGILILELFEPKGAGHLMGSKDFELEVFRYKLGFEFITFFNKTANFLHKFLINKVGEYFL
jgi:hypothetical protein